MSKHTPGPWVALPEEVHRNYIRIRGTVLGRRYKIANVITPDYDDVKEREAKETRANARLIAAAPELFNLAEQVLAWWEVHQYDAASSSDGDEYNFYDSEPEFVKSAKAAIAKATGEKQ